jgi:cellulose synthase/poly-beta-1,6-N-acetylglucosamine synthase-like glycosyltransferase
MRIDKFIMSYPKASQRILEILPGFVSWNLILFPFWGAVFFPDIVALFVLIFNLYWVYRSFSIASRMLRSYARICKSKKTDFMAGVRKHPAWENLHHVIVIPTYKEPEHILERTLTSLAEQDFPATQIIPVIAFEERAGEEINDQREYLLKAKFRNTFAALLFSRHPGNIAGEVKGKSSNCAWAAKTVNEILPSHPEWDEECMTISSADADVVFHKKHFAAVAEKFLSSPKQHREIYQGALMFYNNIEKIPLPMRVFNRLTTAFNISTLVYSKRLINFSTYTMSWKLLKEVGFWDADVIPEDYRIFFKTYFATGGEVSVVPVFLPVFADAAESRGFWSTFVNTYEQVKRWAWGASDDAYIIKNAILDKRAPARDKTLRVLKVLEDHFLWPVNWFVLTFGALAPRLIRADYDYSFFGIELSFITFILMNISLFCVFAIIFIDLRLRPACKNYPLWRKVVTSFGFLLIPVVGLFFAALPGLNAHTRLIFGRYLEYRVTEKI